MNIIQLSYKVNAGSCLPLQSIFQHSRYNNRYLPAPLESVRRTDAGDWKKSDLSGK
ncbi:MAG: hypothetical protein LBU57_03445 [Dysgonamonadaceae bacterium]|nr:hypothetical protein [Dysgonamonadaceae bacterium]